MSMDPLERLAQLSAPPPPPRFDRDLHRRVNHALIVLHLIEAAVAVPWVMGRFAEALIHLFKLTLTGRLSDARPPDSAGPTNGQLLDQ